MIPINQYICEMIIDEPDHERESGTEREIERLEENGVEIKTRHRKLKHREMAGERKK
jgi:hypothetical protein